MASGNLNKIKSEWEYIGEITSTQTQSFSLSDHEFLFMVLPSNRTAVIGSINIVRAGIEGNTFQIPIGASSMVQINRSGTTFSISDSNNIVKFYSR